MNRDAIYGNQTGSSIPEFWMTSENISAKTQISQLVRKLDLGICSIVCMAKSSYPLPTEKGKHHYRWYVRLLVTNYEGS